MTLHLHPLTFEIYRLGGHTPACSSVYVPEEGVIFTGDVMINEPGPGMREARFQEWIGALAWIESLPVVHVVPGHGEICGTGEVRRFRNGFEEMWGMMEGLVKKGTEKRIPPPQTPRSRNSSGPIRGGANPGSRTGEERSGGGLRTSTRR